MTITFFEIIKYFFKTILMIHNPIFFDMKNESSQLTIIHVQYDEFGSSVTYESEGDILISRL